MRPPPKWAMATRDATLDEVNLFRNAANLLRDAAPVVRHGHLDSIRIPLGQMFRSSQGRLTVQPEIESLSTDTLFSKQRRRARPPDQFELSFWRTVATLIEKHPVLMRGSRLLEMDLGDGRTLRIAPDGSLSCVIDDAVVGVALHVEPEIAEIDIEVEPRVDPEVEREVLEEIATFEPVVEQPTSEWKPPKL